jgi:cyclopropane-fatty-acyl-phospholipid synthase
MQYTCAYYPHPGMSIEEAQIAKLDHVARKLELKPGQVVFEAGCGWGGLARHFAQHYGVTVKAYNISQEQVKFARERAKQEGLDGKVEYILDDYRSMQGECDVFVSVGMLEHVGVDNYPVLGDVIHRVLKPHGRGLIHSIGRNKPAPMNAWTEKRIFPGAYPATLAEMMRILEGHQFSVLDVENLRLHYAHTLEAWLNRYEAHIDDVRRMYDERFVRMWRMYLAASQASFLTGALQLFQIVFARPQDNTIPMNREHLYPR